jgi:putative addiction module killer protein
MFSVRPLPEFSRWIDDLKEESVRGVIVARIKRLELGLMGDVQPVGGGVSELRIHVGSGWRLYFTQRGRQILVLLAGGSNGRRSETSGAPKRWLRCWMDRRGLHEKTDYWRETHQG